MGLRGPAEVSLHSLHWPPGVGVQSTGLALGEGPLWVPEKAPTPPWQDQQKGLGLVAQLPISLATRGLSSHAF